MDFSTYVKLLYSVIGTGNTVSAFTRTVLLSVVKYEDDDLNPIYERSRETFKSYYSGHTKITRMAKKICNYLDEDSFVDFLDSFGEITKPPLCAAFSPFILDLDDTNISSSLASELISIIISSTKANSNATIKAFAPTEELSPSAKAFLIDFGDQLNQIPLCLVAKEINPLRKSHRPIYNAFLKLSESEQLEILTNQQFSNLKIQFNKHWINAAINHMEKTIKEHNFSSKSLLYDDAKYFHRALTSYADYPIVNSNPNIMQRIEKPTLKSFSQTKETLLDNLLEYNFSTKKDLMPPVDYLWTLLSLGTVPEPVFVFWTCRLVIDVCHFLCITDISEPKINFEVIDEVSISSFEDLYFYALLLLSIVLD